MKNGLTVLASLVCVAALAALAGWTFYAGARIGGGWGALSPVLLSVIGGLVMVGALTGGLMWLAFFSSRRGYDEPYDVNRPSRRKP